MSSNIKESLMVVEAGILRIKSDSVAKFEEGVAKGRPALENSDGCHRFELRKGIEDPSSYLLLVWWDSIEKHKNFSESDRFQEWIGAIGPHLTGPPDIVHYTADPVG